MPTPAKRLYQHGPFWLEAPDKKYGDYGIKWYDRTARQTRRLGTECTDFGEAKTALDKHALEHGDGAHKDELVLQTIERYYLSYAINLPSAKGVVQTLKFIRLFWPEQLVSEASAQQQRHFITALREYGLSDDSITRYLNNIWAALGYAVQFSHLSSKVIPERLSKRHWGARTQPRKRRSAKASKRPLSVEEWGALFDAADLKGEHCVRYLITQLATHARPSAILELTGIQINLTQGTVDLNPPGREQNKKRRPVLPLVPIFAQWAQAWAVPAGEPVVARGRKRRPMTLRIVRALIARAKIAHCTPYTFRHTVASWLASQGVDKWERKSFLGHTKIDGGNTDDYTHCEPQYLRKAAAAIERLFEAIAPHTRVNLMRRVYEDQGPPEGLWGSVPPCWPSSGAGTRLLGPIPHPALTFAETSHGQEKETARTDPPLSVPRADLDSAPAGVWTPDRGSTLGPKPDERVVPTVSAETAPADPLSQTADAATSLGSPSERLEYAGEVGQEGVTDLALPRLSLALRWPQVGGLESVAWQMRGRGVSYCLENQEVIDEGNVRILGDRG